MSLSHDFHTNKKTGELYTSVNQGRTGNVALVQQSIQRFQQVEVEAPDISRHDDLNNEMRLDLFHRSTHHSVIPMTFANANTKPNPMPNAHQEWIDGLASAAKRARG